MPTDKLRGPHKVIFFFSIALSFALGAVKGSGEGPQIPNFDKLIHFSYYFFLSLYYLKFFNFKDTFVASFAIGLGIEIMQYFLPYRSAEFLDLVANTGGILLALSLWRIKSRV